LFAAITFFVAALPAEAAWATVTIDTTGGARSNLTPWTAHAVVTYVRSGVTYTKSLDFGASLYDGASGLDFVMNASTHPGQFEQLVGFLTDGANDKFFLNLTSPTVAGLPASGGGPWAGGRESVVFAGSSLNGIDLAGRPITALVLHIDHFNLTTPGSNPNGDGIWTDYDIGATLTVVPEPATVGLLAAGVAALAVKRKRKTAR